MGIVKAMAMAMAMRIVKAMAMAVGIVKAMAMAMGIVIALAMAMGRYGDTPVGQSVQYAPLLPASQQDSVAQDFMMHHNTSMNAGTHDTNIQNTNTHTYGAGDT